MELMHLPYSIKKITPSTWLSRIREIYRRVWDFFHHVDTTEIDFPNQFPWCSPDVWARIEGHYSKIDNPTVFEYGMGVSSIWHIKNLLGTQGGYIGVEHDYDWYIRTIAETIRLLIGRTIRFSCIARPIASKASGFSACDTIFEIDSDDIDRFRVVLKYRPSARPDCDCDGKLPEFEDYVLSLDHPCDVIIVDGRARKACINHVLDNSLMSDRGMLVLLEAGRGIDRWLGSPALTGQSNYQPEVNRMLSLGGRLVDGAGVDSWDGLEYRRTPSINAYRYPIEACILEAHVG